MATKKLTARQQAEKMFSDFLDFYEEGGDNGRTKRKPKSKKSELLEVNGKKYALVDDDDDDKKKFTFGDRYFSHS